MQGIMFVDVKKISIAILEDEEIIRNALITLLCVQPDIEIAATYETGEAALDQLSHKPVDVLLFDINLPGISGIETISRLKTVQPQIQCMAITSYDDADNIFNALKAGATGYMLKNIQPDKLSEAIKEIHAGGSPMSSQIARKVVTEFANLKEDVLYSAALSRRENEILQLLAKGFRYKEISAQLFISVETVRTHIRNIYEKLQVKTRDEAIRKVKS
ncbi:MAG TPA: response regulator transcription factor [Ferruginibacter sp.]|nr:response regulator transcription factor [Ferruginibacter sp.]HRN91561.1 response regulator transcription factor [Ferruginibacter sp.]HRO05097.1 response regulator transcription factor [Ferruginibacter sp.]HRO95598.1 response regulator transcription factor [Ferruginibacter sp.]HRP49543.1 response regulator transcription factor [Ferruginibacter sp.]